MSERNTAVDRSRERARMVAQHLRARGIADERVLAAFREVPREAFVDPSLAESAYADAPLPIGLGQTISQPFVVAAMVEALRVGENDRVLEVGAGSGYAAAILSRLAGRVVAVERHSQLADAARGRLAALGFDNVDVRHGDGTRGWIQGAPFDAILVSAGARRVPPALEEQLAVGGRLVIPVGELDHQELLRIVRRGDGTLGEERLGGVSFVPLVSTEPATPGG
ncbi:MAG: protein-L-isoaspartate(D-aspartate) O-methyltransferase [Candidatus Limnocylindrales bacterium]